MSLSVLIPRNVFVGVLIMFLVLPFPPGSRSFLSVCFVLWTILRTVLTCDTGLHCISTWVIMFILSDPTTAAMSPPLSLQAVILNNLFFTCVIILMFEFTWHTEGNGYLLKFWDVPIMLHSIMIVCLFCLFGTFLESLFLSRFSWLFCSVMLWLTFLPFLSWHTFLAGDSIPLCLGCLSVDDGAGYLSLLLWWPEALFADDDVRYSSLLWPLLLAHEEDDVDVIYMPPLLGADDVDVDPVPLAFGDEEVDAFPVELTWKGSGNAVYIALAYENFVDAVTVALV